MKTNAYLLLWMFSSVASASNYEMTVIDPTECELIYLTGTGMTATEDEAFRKQFGNEWRPWMATVFGPKGTREATGRCSQSESGSFPTKCEGKNFPLAGMKFEYTGGSGVLHCKDGCQRKLSRVYVWSPEGVVDASYFSDIKKHAKRCQGFLWAPEFLRTP